MRWAAMPGMVSLSDGRVDSYVSAFAQYDQQSGLLLTNVCGV